MLRDADDLLFRILRRFAVGVDATRRGMDCEMRDYWQLGCPLALSAQPASPFVETRRDGIFSARGMPCHANVTYSEHLFFSQWRSCD